MARKSRAKPPSPFRYFHSSPEVIRMVVMLYVRYPLSLRNVEDLLTEFGSTDDILDVLWAWYGNDVDERCNANVLFISSAHGGGVTYVWPGGRWTVPGPIDGSLQAMLDAVSAALTDYYRGPEGDRQRLFDERMVGAPVFDEADRFGQAVAAHYGLDALPEQLPADFRPRALGSGPIDMRGAI